jgi:hypothetical protein
MPDMRAMLGGSESTTFLGVDSCSVDAIPKDCDVVVLGAPCATPYDWVGPYCKDAPTAIRYSSGTYAASRHHHNFDLDGLPIPDGTSVFDAGDVPWDVDTRLLDIVASSNSKCSRLALGLLVRDDEVSRQLEDLAVSSPSGGRRLQVARHLILTDRFTGLAFAFAS